MTTAHARDFSDVKYYGKLDRGLILCPGQLITVHINKAYILRDLIDLGLNHVYHLAFMCLLLPQ